MPKIILNKFTIKKDSREQKGWDFSPDKNCNGMIIGKLDTGDYSIDGYTDILCIERKASTSEFATNCYEERFDREIDRMDTYLFPFMILEFTWDDLKIFPIGSSIPKHLWGKLKPKAEYMMSRIIDYQVNHKVKIIFAGKNGDLAAMQVFKHVWRYLNKNGMVKNGLDK